MKLWGCAAALGLFWVASAGCPGSGGASSASTSGTGGHTPTCSLADLGDPKQPIVLQVTALGVTNMSTPIVDGMSVDLITPPQGGRVIFIGAKATNLSPCGVVISGSIKDPGNGAVMLDKRTVNLKPQADGYGTSNDTNISTFANIAVCPNQWSSQNIYDQTYEVTLEITDKVGRSASQSVMVVPRCAETEPTLYSGCLCTCKQGYTLGAPCP